MRMVWAVGALIFRTQHPPHRCMWWCPLRGHEVVGSFVRDSGRLPEGWGTLGNFREL